MEIQEPEVDSRYIDTAGTFMLRSAPGRLKKIIWLSTQTFSLIAYDGEVKPENILVSVDVAAADKLIGGPDLGFSFRRGLTVVTTGSPLVTVAYCGC